MPLKFDQQTEQRMIASIKSFVAEHLDEEIGDLKARLFLDFVRQELCPTAYNHGVNDAQAFLVERVADLDSACYEREFTYWER